MGPVIHECCRCEPLQVFSLSERALIIIHGWDSPFIPQKRRNSFFIFLKHEPFNFVSTGTVKDSLLELSLLGLLLSHAFFGGGWRECWSTPGNAKELLLACTQESVLPALREPGGMPGLNPSRESAKAAPYLWYYFFAVCFFFFFFLTNKAAIQTIIHKIPKDTTYSGPILIAMNTE